MRLTRLFEDLDDKDEFVSDCYMCVSNPYIDTTPGFHQDHIQAETRAANQVANLPWSQRRDEDEQRAEAFHNEMERLGYTYDEDSNWTSWTRKPIEEDLDDKDEFTASCSYCEGRTDAVEFHRDHMAAWHQTININPHKPGSGEFWDTGVPIYKTEMEKRGYVLAPDPNPLVPGDNIWVKKYNVNS